MDPQDFEKLDEAWMKRMSALRHKSVPPGAMKGLSDSVLDKIREKEAQDTQPAPRRVFMPVPVRVWAPVFAVLILSLVTVARLPQGSFPSVSDKLVSLTATSASGLAEDIELLSALGEWEEDSSLEDLELASQTSYDRKEV